MFTNLSTERTKPPLKKKGKNLFPLREFVQSKKTVLKSSG